MASESASNLSILAMLTGVILALVAHAVLNLTQELADTVDGLHEC